MTERAPDSRQRPTSTKTFEAEEAARILEDHRRKNERRRRDENKLIIRQTDGMDAALLRIYARRQDQDRIERLQDFRQSTDLQLERTPVVPVRLNIQDLRIQDDALEETLDSTRDTSIFSPVYRTIYKGQKTNFAVFIKHQSAEPSFIYDPSTQEVVERHRVWNEDETSRRYEVVDTDPRLHRCRTEAEYDDMKKNFAYAYNTQETLRLNIAAYYDIPPKEVPLRRNEFSIRRGIEVGQSVLREYAVSRICDLTQLDVVSQTMLRTEGLYTDLFSVQEEAHGELMSDTLYTTLRKEGPRHPGATSLMRLACLDYLVRSSDRHQGNIIYNEKTHTFTGIDNGLSLGLSQVPDHPLDPYRSVALEITQEYPAWKLDDAVWNKLTYLLSNIEDYLQAYKQQTKEPAFQTSNPAQVRLDQLDEPFKHELSSDVEDEGRFLMDLFILLYKQNSKIAETELQEFAKRLKYLVQNGRPPQLSDDLWIVGSEDPIQTPAEPAKTSHAA